MSDPLGGLDCSPEAQAERRQQLADLRAALYSGVQTVTDRNRTVTYSKPDAIAAAIRALQAQVNACEAGAWPRRQRVFHVPQVKDL